MSRVIRPLALVATSLCLATAPVFAAAPTNEELYEVIQKLEAEVQALKARLDQQQRAGETQAQQDRQQDQAQQQQIEALAQSADAAPPATVASRVQLGGYGEMHYNNLDSKHEVDFHRFVLYTGYEFNDWSRFVSELELEHALAGEGKPGEIELEQAYVEFDLPAAQKAKAGLFLVPVGILNETHEPTTFYGVERNLVENAIIPSTWWEGGAALSGPIAGSGLSYDFAAHSGLKIATTGASAFSIRGGRQKVANARADDIAYTGRLRYRGLPGLELATSVQYQADASQGADSEKVRALLTEAHAIFERGPFSARALWANWTLDGAAAQAAGRDQQDGWYGELGYRVLTQVGVFGRYSVADTGEVEVHQTELGLNWWPHENVVLKADWQDQEQGADVDGFNLGVGYRF